jgi:small subunit ribosomal protein S8
MAVTDPIADFLTIIRNGGKAGFKHVDIPASKIKIQITKILYAQGYLKRYIIIEDKGNKSILRIWLKYDESGKPLINHIRRISKPGRRTYVGTGALPRVLNNLGVAILTTPKGIMTAHEAQRNHVGGEVLCYVY